MLVTVWAGLRGAASIVSAIMAVAGGADVDHDLFHIAFCVSLPSAAFQGTLLPWISKRLGMVDGAEDVSRTFTDYQDASHYEDNAGIGLKELPVAAEWDGRRVKELGIPAETLIVLIRRPDGTTVVPKGGTVAPQGRRAGGQ